MPTVSFCVPVYNRADRVRRCIESLINQTAPNDEYEVIVVDDGSTDGTAKAVQDIFDEHGFANGRVHTLPVNSGGASAPRNAAVAMARGDYLFFVDSDDYVAPQLVEKIRSFAAEFDPDIIYPQYRREDESGVVTSEPHAFAQFGDIGEAEILTHRMLNAMSVLKAFKRSAWERLGITFDAELRTGEDVLVTARFLFNTSKHSVIADQVYYMIVDHGEVRLTQTPTARAATFRNYGDILDIIYAGSLGDLDFKHKAAARFVNRIMRTGAGANNAFLEPSVSKKSQNEWSQLFSGLLERHLPVEADQYVAPMFRQKVKYLRSGDLVGARFAAAFYELNDSQPELFDELLLHIRAADDAASARERRLIVALRSARAEVKAARSEPKSVSSELESVYSSTSWRATAPLRASSRFAKRLVRAARNPRRAAAKARAWLMSTGRRGVRVAALQLDEDGRPEVVLGALPVTQGLAVFASVDPPGHRDARHRLPFRSTGPLTIAARLPVPPGIGESFVRLSVQSDGELHPVRVGRRTQRAQTSEIRVTSAAEGIRIERIVEPAPWQPVSEPGTRR